MSHILRVIFGWSLLYSVCGFLQNVPGASDDSDPGEPLFLTPYLERGDLDHARRLARVTLGDSFADIESYSGFFTVDKAYDSNHFFWYFPAMSEDRGKAPVVLWLQGGPGESSMFGLFVENGPIQVVNNTIERRQYHWALNHHLLYIDSPVGAGFSFTNDTKGYCTNETQVGEQLYSTLTQFFQLFPELQPNDFFITGESYAGKYVPALAYTIMKKAETKVNLKGLAIGGPWINPDTQKYYTKYDLCRDDSRNIQKVLKVNETINDQWENKEYVPVINTNEVRKAIHVGDSLFTHLNGTVYSYLTVDVCQSMAPWLSEILDRYPVTLYDGELDEIVQYKGVVDFLRNHFNFTGAEEYKLASRYEWRVDGKPAGCVRRARRLTEIYVLGATHYAPADQPKRVLDMITRITSGKGFDQKEICNIP